MSGERYVQAALMMATLCIVFWHASRCNLAVESQCRLNDTHMRLSLAYRAPFSDTKHLNSTVDVPALLSGASCNAADADLVAYNNYPDSTCTKCFLDDTMPIEANIWCSLCINAAKASQLSPRCALCLSWSMDEEFSGAKALLMCFGTVGAHVEVEGCHREHLFANLPAPTC